MANKDKLVYPIIAAEHNDDGHYFVATSPNIPGMVTQGSSMLDLVNHAEDAIATMLDGTTYPEVQDPTKWTLQPNESVVYVVVNMKAWLGRDMTTVKKSITVPAYLSKMAKEQKINVSRLTSEALEEIYNNSK